MRALWLFVFLPLVIASLHAEEEDIQTIPAKQLTTELETISGDTIQPLSCKDGSKFAALIFITTDCPIANAYAPEIGRLDAFVAASGGKLTLVHVDAERSAKEAAQHAADYGLKSPVVIDREHQLVSATGATVTPEAALVGPDGALIYRGRINDLFAGYGERRRQATTHDLKQAITSFLNGETLESARIEAVGCYIPEL